MAWESIRGMLARDAAGGPAPRREGRHAGQVVGSGDGVLGTREQSKGQGQHGRTL